jgi:hypothetical protein
VVPDLPVLIGVGPVRTGTSWVHELFFDHPEASVTRVKEVNYFRDLDKPVEWYFDQFQTTTSETKILVDISPSGFGLPNIAVRIRREIRNPYVLISPYERLLSCYFAFGDPYESFPTMAKVYCANMGPAHMYQQGYVNTRNALDGSESFFFHSMSWAMIPLKCRESYKADSDCSITNRPAQRTE